MSQTASGRSFSLPLEGLLPEQGRRVAIDGRELAVFLLSNGTARCVENRCPHRGGSLAEGIVAGQRVHCTQHDWRIDLNCGEAMAPDQGCVKTFPCRIEAGHVVIEI